MQFLEIILDVSSERRMKEKEIDYILNQLADALERETPITDVQITWSEEGKDEHELDHSSSGDPEKV